MYLCGRASLHCAMGHRSLMVDSMSYFLFQPVLHDWYNRPWYMVYIKDPLLLIEKSSLFSGGSRFPFSLFERSFTVCPTPCNCKSVECIINISFLPC